MSKFLKKLESTFREIPLEIIEHHPKHSWIRVPADSLKLIAQFIKEPLGFDHAISVSIIDDLENNQFIIDYHLSSVFNSELHGIILTLEVTVNRTTPAIPSLRDIFPSVEFHEREGWEMFGVKFEGHPKLERLLLPENWKGGHPLRKDFKMPEEST
ncbi:MAG: NADH-quinone oxidoreductase subunit C [Candidatus Thorarchaeota archaeon]